MSNVNIQMLALATHLGLDPVRYMQTYDMIADYFKPQGGATPPDLLNYLMELREEGTINCKELTVLTFAFGNVIGNQKATQPKATSNFHTMMEDLNRKAGNKFIDN